MNEPLNTAASDVFAIFKRMNPLIQHACEGNVDEVRKLLGEDNSHEQAAVMGAVIGGHVECLKLFLPLVGQKNWELALASAAMEGKSACIVQYMDVLNPRKQTGLIRAFPCVSKHINTVD